MRAASIVGIIGVAVFAGDSMSAEQKPPDPRQPAVRLLVVNRANVRPEVLKAAEDDAGIIYRAASVQATSVNVGAADVSNLYAVDFIVMIVTGREGRLMAARVDRTAMGFATCDSNDDAKGAGMAFVLFDRVEDNAAKHHVMTSRVLGKVIAHEVGHLLLPSNSHSEDGIMRGVWDLRSGLLEYFTSAQTQPIQQQLMLAPGRAACRPGN